MSEKEKNIEDPLTEDQFIDYTRIEDLPEFEKTFRHALSGCTKGDLIESVVRRELELQRQVLAMRNFRDKHLRLLGGIELLQAMMSEKCSNPDRLIEALKNYFNHPELSDLAKAVSAAIKRSYGRRSQKKKIENDADGKQAAISILKDAYRKWQSHPNPKSIYRTYSDFALAEVEKIQKHKNGDPIISVSHIEKNLIGKWKKEFKEGRGEK